MELGGIRAFVAVTEAGSINRAAHELRLSQPAVTRQVQRLEAELGVLLLDWRVKPLALTTAGRVVLEQCRRILKDVEELRAVTATAQGLTGECRIGVAHALAEVALAGPVDRLRRAFPRLTLRVTTGWSRDLLDQVRAGVLDVAVVQIPGGARLPADLRGQVVGAESLVFVASRRRRLPKVLNLSDLLEASWVLNPEGCGFRLALRRALQRMNAPLRVAVEAYGTGLQLSLVARGAGLGLVPARVLARSRVRARLQAVRVRGYDFRLAVWTVHARPPAGLAPVLTALDQEIKRVLGGAG